LWMIRRFESDVENGGFTQFLANAFDSRDGKELFLRDTVKAARALGLRELIPLLVETVRIHEETVRFEQAMDGKFERLYERFCDLRYSWQPKLDAYITQNPEKFVFSARPAR